MLFLSIITLMLVLFTFMCVTQLYAMLIQVQHKLDVLTQPVVLNTVECQKPIVHIPGSTMFPPSTHT